MKSGIAGLIVFLGTLIFISSCQSDESLEFKRYYSAGAEVYQTHCQNCHGAKGEGLSALIPPLTDSVYLKTNKTSLACYTQFGLKGTISVHGKAFDGTMPATDLAPREIAQVLTYVTNSFGNNLGVVTTDQVQADQKNCR